MRLKAPHFSLALPVFGFVITFSLFITRSLTAENFTALRQSMVQKLEKENWIQTQKVKRAMLKVQRHLLVPQNARKNSYKDLPLPIGFEQTISAPSIVALMTEALQLKGTERVLEVGTGSGYQAAVLAEIVREVYTIEIIKELAIRARKNLKKMKYKNIHIKTGDGFLGWKEFAPFDAIIVTCAVSFVPPPLLKQLKNNGRLIVPLGREFEVQTLTLIQRHNEKFTYTPLEKVLFVPMLGENVKKM